MALWLLMLLGCGGLSATPTPEDTDETDATVDSDGTDVPEDTEVEIIDTNPWDTVAPELPVDTDDTDPATPPNPTDPYANGTYQGRFRMNTVEAPPPFSISFTCTQNNFTVVIDDSAPTQITAQVRCRWGGGLLSPGYNDMVGTFTGRIKPNNPQRATGSLLLDEEPPYDSGSTPLSVSVNWNGIFSVNSFTGLHELQVNYDNRVFGVGQHGTFSLAFQQNP